MTARVCKLKNKTKKLFATSLVASFVLTACGGSSETDIVEVEVEKQTQSPLVFTFSQQEYFIDEQPEFDTLIGGSGSGDISFTVSDSSIASVDVDSGELNLVDDGTFTITAIKAGDDVYESTSASYQLTVNKYDRNEFQFLSFVDERFVVDLDSGHSPGNVFLPSVDVPNSTSVVDVDFNLPANATLLDASLFNPNDSLWFNAATSITVYDSLGEDHIQTFYFIKDSAAFDGSPSRNDWYVVTSVDDVMVDYANADGSAPDEASPNLVGTLLGISGVTGLPGVAAARLSFSESGDFTGLYAADGIAPTSGELQTVQLGSGVLSNGADLTQELKLNLFLDTSGGMDLSEPTQLPAPFEISRFQQDGYRAGWLSESLLSYESANSDIATVNDLGELILLERGQTRINVTIAEDEMFLQTSVSYQLVVE